jgi:uncharacterized protein (TIGR03083 family)
MSFTPVAPMTFSISASLYMRGPVSRVRPAEGVRVSDINQLVVAETERLAGMLDGLDEVGWSTPSSCAGWRVRDVVAHLLMPYQLSIPSFLVKITAARFDFDRLSDRWATGNGSSNRDLVESLRATPHQKFNVPGAPAEAPLSHLVIHGEDIYRPLGTWPTVDVEAANATLRQMTQRGFVTKGLLDGIALTTTDTGWSFGEGAEVKGTASALITTIAGRRAALEDLSGAGAAQLGARLGAG